MKFVAFDLDNGIFEVEGLKTTQWIEQLDTILQITRRDRHFLVIGYQGLKKQLQLSKNRGNLAVTTEETKLSLAKENFICLADFGCLQWHFVIELFQCHR